MRIIFRMIRRQLSMDTVLGLLAFLYAAIFFPQFTLTIFLVIAAITGAGAVLVLAMLFGHAIRQGWDSLRSKS